MIGGDLENGLGENRPLSSGHGHVDDPDMRVEDIGKQTNTVKIKGKDPSFEKSNKSIDQGLLMNDGGNDTDNDKEARNNVMTPNVDKNRDDN